MATFMHNDFTIENIEMFWLNVQKIALKNNGGYDLRSFHLKLLFEIQTQSRPERPKIKLCSEKSLIFFEMNLVIKHLSFHIWNHLHVEVKSSKKSSDLTHRPTHFEPIFLITWIFDRRSFL